jgi:hypothetical protein
VFAIDWPHPPRIWWGPGIRMDDRYFACGDGDFVLFCFVCTLVSVIVCIVF